MTTTQTVIVVAIVALVVYLMVQAKHVTQTVSKAAGGGTSVWSQLASGAAAGLFQGAVSLFSKSDTHPAQSSGADRDGLMAPNF